MSQCISSSQLIWLVPHRLRVHKPWSFPMRMIVPEQGGNGRGGGGDTVAPRHRARRGRFGWCVQHGRAAIPHDSLLEMRHTQKHDYQNVCRAHQHLIPCANKSVCRASNKSVCMRREDTSNKCQQSTRHQDNQIKTFVLPHSTITPEGNCHNPKQM